MNGEVNKKPKKILVRRNPHSNSSTEFPACSKDSTITGISLNTPQSTSDCPPESEEELQVIEMGSSSNENTPLLIIFPELRQEGLNTNSITSKMSTTELTKLLVGKKATFPLLRKNQKLFDIKDMLSPIEEFPGSASYEQIKWKSPRSTLSSEFTDLSDEESD